MRKTVLQSTASLLAALCCAWPRLSLSAPSQELPAPTPAANAQRWRGADAMFDALCRELLRDAQSPSAIAQLHRLWNLNRLLERDQKLRQTLSALMKRKLPALLRDHVTYYFALTQLQKGALEEAGRQFTNLGFPEKVLMLGPFDNAAGAGHHNTFAPERSLKSAAGQPWRTIEPSPQGALELSALIHPSNAGTVYIAFAIDSARPTRAVLRTGAHDQLKIFLNGALVQDIDTRRAAAFDQDATPLTLPRGRSVVLIKSSWTGDIGRLFVRLTRPAGGALSGVRISADPVLLNTAVTRKARKARWRFEHPRDRLDAAIRRARGPSLARLLGLRADLFEILELYDARKLPSPPERDLRAAIQLLPSDPLLRFFFSHRIRARDLNLAKEQLDAALICDPGFAPGYLELGQIALAAQRLLDARDLFERAIAVDPSFIPAHVARASLGFDELGEDALAALRLQRLSKLSSSAMGLGELARIRRALNDPDGALQAALGVLKIDQGQPLARHLTINLLLEKGDLKGAMAQLDAGLAFRPHALSDWLRKAKLLQGQGRSEEALNIADALHQRFEGHPVVPKTHAELLLWSQKPQLAIAQIRRSLALDPHQRELRRRLRALSGARPVQASTLEPLKLLETPVSQEERQWGAIYLADHSVHQLYKNGKSSRFKQIVLRLRNPRLKDALRVHRISYSPSRETVEIIAAERIRPSGEIVRASRISDSGPSGKVSGMYVDQRYKLILFDDLAQGDLVHLRYRIDSLGENIFGGFFGDIEGLQGPLPKRNVLYEITSPEDRPLYPSGVRVAAPQVLQQDDRVTLRWKYEGIAALEREPNAPPYPERGMLVSVSTYKNWNDLGAWYGRLFSEQLELDETARNAGRQVVKSAKTEEEKIKRLYHYVVKNTRYVGIELGIHGWKPFKASEVHRRRYGDCKDKSTLLAALLRDNGIDATITLVRTADRGKLPEDHPTMWAFNHAITYVPSKKLFLDPTAEFSGSTELPHLDQGAMALIVRPDGATELTQLPLEPAVANLNSSSYTAKLSAEGALELEGTERFFGARAASLRQEYEVAEKRKPKLERQLNQVFEGVSVEQLKFSKLGDLEAPVEYRYTAKVERYGKLEAQRMTIPIALFQHEVSGAYGTLSKRKLDLYISHPWSTRNVVRYSLPQGAKLVELPQGIEVDTPHISLSQKIRKVEGGFETDDRVTLKSRVIPAGAYEVFREACLKIDRALARKVVFQW